VIKLALLDTLEPYEYKELPIESVEADEEAKVRVYYDFSDLIESIRKVGQLMPGYAYKDGDKYKVFVGMRRLLAVKKLYEQEGKPAVFKAFVFEKKPKNFYALIREENMKRSSLTGLDKVHIIMKYVFANQLLPAHDARYISLFKVLLHDVPIQEIYELALVEQRAKAKGHENHLSLEELLFLFRDLHSLEERKLFALLFLLHRVHVKHAEIDFKEFAVENAPKLKPRDFEIAGLSKEDVDKIIAMYKAPPYQAEIIKERFEEHLLPKSTVQEQPKESENKRETESTREASEEEVITMHLDVQYENINGHRIMFIKKESGIHVLVVENGQEIEINGVKVKILY
jgi:hypothetical protein